MSSLTQKWTFFSTTVGGGGHGKGAGIARGTMIQAGPTIKGSHPFIEEYRQVGGMTTGIITGEGIHGTTSGYLTNNFSETGVIGKETGIGKSSKPGVSKT